LYDVVCKKRIGGCTGGGRRERGGRSVVVNYSGIKKIVLNEGHSLLISKCVSFCPLSLAALLPRQDLPGLGLVCIFHRDNMDSTAIVQSSLGGGRGRDPCDLRLHSTQVQRHIPYTQKGDDRNQMKTAKHL
jgi:hypothetical protein